MSERSRILALCAMLVVVVALLSWAILGPGEPSNCRHGGWFGYTPLTGKIITVGECPSDLAVCQCDTR